MNTFTTKDLPDDARPYEKCLKYGTVSLSDSELLAIFLRCGVQGMNSIELSSLILKKGGDKGLVGLNGLSWSELTQIKGIGRVKAIQIQCIAEMSRRIAKGLAKEALEFNDTFSVANYFMEDLRHLDREHLVMAMFDTKNHFIGESTVSIGTVNASLISPREILVEALRSNAVKIILLHNHPSGNPTPSKEDIMATIRLSKACDDVGIVMLDHIIIGDNRYISLREQGYFTDND